MGKGRNRKPFIDKSKATTYNLLYRASEVMFEGEDASPERELVEASRGVGIGRPDAEAAAAAADGNSGGRCPPNHPLSMFQDPPPDNMSEERRRELIEMGFPDDGYDYLKHMRAPGRSGRANLEGAGPMAESAGPSVIVPATEQQSQLADDARIYDASQLSLHQPAEDEESAGHAMGGISAFSKQRQRMRQQEMAEVAAMEELLADPQFEDAEGDLEDDFVLAATQAEAEEQAAEAAAQASTSDHPAALAAFATARGYSDSDDDEAAASDASSQSRSDWAPGEAGGARSQYDAKPGSIASTYWRAERSDRKNLLSVVDERFEHLALDYDEDDIGSLDEEDPEAQGTETLDAFDGLMDEFLATHEGAAVPDGEASAPHGIAYRSTADIARSGTGPDAAAAAKAIEQAKRLAQEDAAAAATHSRPQDFERHAEAARERWDVESVLSLRSNLDNHPASIAEPQSSRRSRQQVLGAAASDSCIPLGRNGVPVPASYGGSSRRGGQAQRSGLRRLPEEYDSDSASSQDGASVATSMATLPRRKDETAKEKKARKGAVKESKRAARVAKKELKGHFKQEYERQKRAMAAPAPATVSLP